MWGQLIGIILMQIGGLGLITIITASLFYFYRRLSLKSQYIFSRSDEPGILIVTLSDFYRVFMR